MNYLIVGLIVTTVFAFLLDNVPGIHETYGPWPVGFETFAVAVFTVEYVGRIWVAPENERHRGAVRWRLRWLVSPLGIVDLLAILPFYLGFFFPADLLLLRLFGLFRILRLAKIARYSRSLKTMTRVVRRKRRELGMALFVLSLFLVLAAWLIGLSERSVQP
jgi:voltage-gated potassium channel